MRGIKYHFSLPILCLAIGCGGATPEAEAPPAPEPVEPAPEPEPEPPKVDEPTVEAPEEAPGDTLPEPEFKDGMSVNEAIAAVPQGGQRINLDSDTLGKPLTDPDVYAPCKLKPNDHFKLKVAVYAGRAVGIDVNTSNAKLAECIKAQIKKVTWADKVPSLNTVEYEF